MADQRQAPRISLAQIIMGSVPDYPQMLTTRQQSNENKIMFESSVDMTSKHQAGKKNG